MYVTCKTISFKKSIDMPNIDEVFERIQHLLHCTLYPDIVACVLWAIHNGTPFFQFYLNHKSLRGLQSDWLEDIVCYVGIYTYSSTHRWGNLNWTKAHVAALDIRVWNYHCLGGKFWLGQGGLQQIRFYYYYAIFVSFQKIGHEERKYSKIVSYLLLSASYLCS